MNNLKDYVNWKLTHADKTAEAEGYPLTMENCKRMKKMKELKIYGNSVQDGTPTPEAPVDVVSVGELVTDEADANYGKYRIPVIARGINLFSMTKAGLTEQTINGITFTPLDDERIHIKGKIIDNTQDAIYNSLFKTKIPVKADVYNLKRTQYTERGLTLMVSAYDNKNAFLINFNAINTNQSITKDGTLARLYVGITKSNTREWDDIIQIQLTKGTGTKNLPYEPYVEPITTNVFLDEPLRKIGNYADYIDFKNDKVVRKNYKQVFNSSIPANEAVQGWQREEHYCYICFSALKVEGIRGVKAYSNRFKQGNWVWEGNIFPDNYFYQAQNDTNLHVIINKQYLDGITDESTSAEKVAAFKAFFDKYETYLIYPRKTPIEEPLNIELPQLPAKTAIIEVDTTLLPSDAYGKYIKK